MYVTPVEILSDFRQFVGAISMFQAFVRSHWQRLTQSAEASLQ